MYKVIKFFTDLQDNNYAYKVGDIFPHSGLEVSKKRLDELSSNKNKQRQPLIEKVEDEEPMNPPTEEVVEKPEEIVADEEIEKPKRSHKAKAKD